MRFSSTVPTEVTPSERHPASQPEGAPRLLTDGELDHVAGGGSKPGATGEG